MAFIGKIRLRGITAAFAACLLGSTAAEAALYVGSSNDLGNGSGAIYQYSSMGTLLATTDPGFAGGSGVLLTAQAGTGNIYASTGGYLQKLSPGLSSREVVGSGFGTFTTIASMSDGRIVAGATASNNELFWWNASGAYSGSFGGGWLDSTVAVGLNDTLFTVYNTGSQFNLGTWSSALSFNSITAGNVGNRLAVNLATGQLWTAGNTANQVLRFDASGSIIDGVGSGWADANIASASDGTMWLTTSAFGGSLASWSSDGTYLGTFQTGIGNIAALAVDPLSGEVYVGLTDASGGGINRYSSSGAFIDSFGSNLGITSLIATVPEPASLGLVVSFLSLVALRRRGLRKRIA